MDKQVKKIYNTDLHRENLADFQATLNRLLIFLDCKRIATVETIWADFGANEIWDTIVIHKNGSNDSYQLLSFNDHEKLKTITKHSDIVKLAFERLTDRYNDLLDVKTPEQILKLASHPEVIDFLYTTLNPKHLDGFIAVQGPNDSYLTVTDLTDMLCENFLVTLSDQAKSNIYYALIGNIKARYMDELDSNREFLKEFSEITSGYDSVDSIIRLKNLIIKIDNEVTEKELFFQQFTPSNSHLLTVDDTDNFVDFLVGKNNSRFYIDTIKENAVINYVLDNYNPNEYFKEVLQALHNHKDVEDIFPHVKYITYEIFSEQNGDILTVVTDYEKELKEYVKEYTDSVNSLSFEENGPEL